MEKTKKQEAIEKLSKIMNQDFENVEVDEDLLELNLKAQEFYSQAVKKYLRTVAVIEFNVVRALKEKTAEYKTREAFNNFVVQAIKDMQSAKELSFVQEIELRTLKNFKHKVLDGHGKEYDITKKFKFDYDGQELEFNEVIGENKVA